DKGSGHHEHYVSQPATGEIPGLASGPTPPVRHYSVRSAGDRLWRRFEAHLWSWRCPPSRRYHRQGPHHCRAWKSALCDGDCTAGEVVKQGESGGVYMHALPTSLALPRSYA